MKQKGLIVQTESVISVRRGNGKPLITTSSEAGMQRGLEAERRTSCTRGTRGCARRSNGGCGRLDGHNGGGSTTHRRRHGERRGVSHPGGDEFDDSTAATRLAARLPGAGALDAVAQQDHYRLVVGAFGLSLGIIADVRKGCTLHDKQDCSSACAQLERLQQQLILASYMTTTAETILSRNHDERDRMMVALSVLGARF